MQGFENLLQHPRQPQQFGIEIDNVEVFFVDNKENFSGGVNVSQTPTIEIDERQDFSTGKLYQDMLMDTNHPDVFQNVGNISSFQKMENVQTLINSLNASEPEELFGKCKVLKTYCNILDNHSSLVLKSIMLKCSSLTTKKIFLVVSMFLKLLLLKLTRGKNQFPGQVLEKECSYTFRQDVSTGKLYQDMLMDINHPDVFQNVGNIPSFQKMENVQTLINSLNASEPEDIKISYEKEQRRLQALMNELLNKSESGIESNDSDSSLENDNTKSQDHNTDRPNRKLKMKMNQQMFL
ncbi:hypothetical protein JTB14_024669 [Gonioctena quinquepunctata]|nr:hypothetical protein JTB14_024669 [Gonioctena quinquepunctata]